MKGNKLKVMFVLISSLVIISTAAYAFFQIKQNHQANMLLIDDCLSAEGTVTVETTTFRLSTVECEQN